MCLHLLTALQDAENNWQFDVFAFAEATPGVTLALLTFHFYKISGCISHFGLDPVKLWRYLQRVESGYQMQNPYHNRSVADPHTLCLDAAKCTVCLDAQCDAVKHQCSLEACLRS